MNKLSLTLLLILFPALAYAGDRGLDLSGPFAHKGAWMAGGNAGVSSHVEDNAGLSVVETYSGDGYGLKFSPYVAYLFKDNMAVGLRGLYKRNLLQLDEVSAKAGELSVDVKNYYYLSHKGGAEVFFRPYMPLGQSGRFALYADLALGMSLSEAKNTQLKADVLTGTWQKGFSVYVGVDPGISAFITDWMAVEVQLNLLNLGLSSTKQIHNQEDQGSDKRMRGNFMIDVTAISAGLSFYFGK